LPYEEFKYSSSNKSVTRIVHLSNGRKISTRLQTKNMELEDEDAHSAFDYTYLRRCNPLKQASYSSKIFRAVDLFCGCGGLSLGAEEACNAMGKRLLSVAAVDKNPAFLNVYKENFARASAYEHFVERTIDGEIGTRPTKNEVNFLRKIKNVDVLLAGPPCQGHSNLNNHTRHEDERNVLYERVARFVEIAKPKHVLIENVPEVTQGKDRTMQRSINAMRELEYEVDSDIIDLAALGVPQRRKRHLVIASVSKKFSIQEILEKYSVERERSVKWAIEDLENEPPNGIFAAPSNLSETNLERIRFLHENDAYDLPDWLRPLCHRNGNTYPSMYGRIRYDEPSQTITGGFLSPGQGRFVHPTQLRTLTPHEAARLQFFPDFFDFSSVKTKASLSAMIGNAVPMKMSYIFCLELLA